MSHSTSPQAPQTHLQIHPSPAAPLLCVKSCFRKVNTSGQSPCIILLFLPLPRISHPTATKPCQLCPVLPHGRSTGPLLLSPALQRTARAKSTGRPQVVLLLLPRRGGPGRSGDAQQTRSCIPPGSMGVGGRSPGLRRAVPRCELELGRRYNLANRSLWLEKRAEPHRCRFRMVCSSW